MTGTYVGPSGPAPARIMLVGEAPGATEEQQGKPFCGAAGSLLTEMLHEGGIPRSECFITNVCRFRPNYNNIELCISDKKKWALSQGMVPYKGRYCLPWVVDHIEHLRREIALVNPNCIVAFGNTPLWALTGQRGILDWRGSEMSADFRRPDGRPWKVIPAIHPAAILRQYSWRFITCHDLRKVCREAATPEIHVPNYTFLVRPSFRAVVEFLDDLLRRLDAGPYRFTCDIETRTGKIACLGIGISATCACCIPFMSVKQPAGYWSFEEELAIVQLLQRVLGHPNATVIGQNFIYDEQYLAKWLGVVPRRIWDTMTAHHVCFPGLEKGLDFLSSLYCEHHLFWKNEGKEWNSKIPEEEYWTYNCKDCVITYEVAQVLDKTVESLGLQEQNQFQQELNQPVLRMMLRGVRVDERAREVFNREVTAAMQERLEYVERICGHPLNPRSPVKMKALFYDDLQQQQVLDRKTKKPTTNEEAMDRIGKREPLLRPLCKAINEYRSLGVFKGTFIEAEMDV